MIFNRDSTTKSPKFSGNFLTKKTFFSRLTARNQVIIFIIFKFNAFNDEFY